MNKTFKKILALLTTLTMALSLFAVAPVLATEGDITPVALAELRKNTNLIPSNANFDEAQGEGALAGWGLGDEETTIQATITNEKSYSGNYSLRLDNKSAANAYYTRKLTGFKPSTAYIISLMALGIEANNSQIQYEGTQYENTAYAYYYNDPSGSVTNAKKDLFSFRPMASDWTNLWSTFTTSASVNKDTVIGPAFFAEAKDVVFYTDDYYIGELMVAGLKNNTASSSVAIPESGTAELTLSVEAINQLGTNAGLDGTTYSYSLLYPVDGVSINNNKLTVSSDAQAGTISVVAKANPTFAGASAQSDEIKARRRKVIDITLTQATVATTDIYEEVRENTNLFKKAIYVSASNAYGLEAENSLSAFKKKGSAADLSAERSKNQAYNGEWSLLVKSPSEALDYVITEGQGMWKSNKTYVSSFMVLGTEANASLIESEKNREDAYKTKLQAKTASWSYKSNIVTAKGNNSVWIKDISVAPASTSPTPNSPKIEKEKWAMVYGCAEIGDDTGIQLYEFGTGIYDEHGVSGIAEFYADDFYYGELIVANVDVQPSATNVAVPENGNATVTLTATAYNQLGNTEYLALNESAPYTYEILTGPAGVSVDNAGVITVPAGTEAGKVNVKVTANPTFLGADTQTADQKASRVKTVTISVEAPTVFTFSVSSGKVTPTATIEALGSDAKVSCALYKVLENGTKKLMGINSAVLAAGQTRVSLNEITIPTTYDYELKCFMWYKGTMKNVIPAVIWE